MTEWRSLSLSIAQVKNVRILVKMNMWQARVATVLGHKTPTGSWHTEGPCISTACLHLEPQFLLTWLTQKEMFISEVWANCFRVRGPRKCQQQRTLIGCDTQFLHPGNTCGLESNSLLLSGLGQVVLISLTLIFSFAKWRQQCYLLG